MTLGGMALGRLAVIPALAVAALAVAVMSACGGESPAATVESTARVADAAAAVSPGGLILYVGRSESLAGPIIEQFAELTGIDAEVKYGGTAELAATLLEEGDRSPADVFFAQDPGGLGAVEGMFAPLPASILERVPEWARSPDGRWVGVSGRARTLVYSTAALSEDDLPDDVWELAEPRWKGRIGWAPTNASFQAMVTAMRAVWGEDRTREWLEAMQANDPVVYPKNTPQVAAAAAGEIDVGMVNHYYLFRFLAEEGDSFPARNYHFRAGGPGAVVMVAGAGILETSSNRDNAEKFVDFMLSQAAQQYFAGQTFEYPLVEGIETSELLVPLDEVSRPDVLPRDMADLEGTVRLLQETGALP